MKLISVSPKYQVMTLEKRANLVPPKNVISIQPATERGDYFYTGNGHFYLENAGGVETEEIVVTDEHLYEPRWAATPLPPDLRPYIDEIRRSVLEGEPEKADYYIDKAQREAGYDKLTNLDRQIVYPIGSLSVHKAFSMDVECKDIEQGTVTDYLRFLDMESGVSSTTFKSGNVSHRHDLAASFKDNIAAFVWKADSGKLDLKIGIKLPGGPNVFGEPTMAGSSYQWIIEDNLLVLAWQYDPKRTTKGYYAFLQIDSVDGDVQISLAAKEVTPANSDKPVIDPAVTIEAQNGTELSIWAKIVKIEENFSFDGYKTYVKEFTEIEKNFATLVEDNKAVLGEKMARSSICLGKEEDRYLSGEELLKKCHSKQELYPMLMDKLYDMGRFYQIIDTGDIPPMWGQHNINTNLQVCAGNNTGLLDEMDVYFKYYESKFEDFRVNAERLFGARGLLASVHCDPDSGLFYHFSKTYPHYCWTGCLGWIYNEFWGYYLVTGDLEFLEKRVVPAIKEIALFFEDYACLRDERGKSIFVPSFSPEDPTPNPDYSTATCKDHHATRINSVMDVAICREVLTNLIEACNTLGIEQEQIPKWQTQLEDLPVYLLDEEGALKEWAWERIEENYNHRHVSHHYDLWPGRAVTVDKEPEVAEAILLSNRKRGQQDDSAHGIIHRAFCALRLKDKEEFIQNMSQLINHGFVRNTLSTNHFPYRLQFPDLQGAMPALLLEMCVYSEPGMVEFLPALPNEFARGELKGIWLYTFAKLEEMKWDETGFTATIKSNKAQTIRFVSRDFVKQGNLTGKNHARNGKNHARFIVNGKEVGVGEEISYNFEAGEKIELRVIMSEQ